MLSSWISSGVFHGGAVPCRWQVHPQSLSMTRDLWWRVIQRAQLSPFSKYTANHLDSHRGQLVISYPEIPEAGKGWQGWGRRTRCDSSAPLQWENKTGLVQATVKWQDILVVGSIVICFGNILDISLLCWAGEEEVFEPLNPVCLAQFLFTAVREGKGNTWA